MLHIKFLGAIRVSQTETDLSQILTGRALALFAYLTVSGQPYDRNTVANLLWPNISQRKAKTNLCYVLRLLRREVAPYLYISRRTVAFRSEQPYWSDLETFSRNIATLLHPSYNNTTLLQQTIDLYQADFLSGFSLRDAPRFDHWLSGQRQALRTQMVQGLYKLASLYAQVQNYHAALNATHRLLALEPWNEAVQRQQMELCAYANQRAVGVK